MNSLPSTMHSLLLIRWRGEWRQARAHLRDAELFGHADVQCRCVLSRYAPPRIMSVLPWQTRTNKSVPN